MWVNEYGCMHVHVCAAMCTHAVYPYLSYCVKLPNLFLSFMSLHQSYLDPHDNNSNDHDFSDGVIVETH